MNEFVKLQELVAAAVDDVDKCHKNKAAGTRVRKHMQAIKAQAQEVRKAVLAQTKDK